MSDMSNMSKLTGLIGMSERREERESLDRAIRALRSSVPPQQLSADRRAEIVESVQRQSEPAVGTFPSVFTPARRLVAAGVLPVLLAAGLLVLLNGIPVAPPIGVEVVSATSSAPIQGAHQISQVQVSKDGNRVVFQIANGTREHFVYRSTVPNSFDDSSAVQVKDGEFLDNLDDRADLVFYKID